MNQATLSAVAGRLFPAGPQAGAASDGPAEKLPTA